VSEEESAAIGWASIDEALERLYGDQEPRHWAAVPHAALGGDNPLDGISIYQAPEPPHWRTAK
jgi:hypothetical protein